MTTEIFKRVDNGELVKIGMYDDELLRAFPEGTSIVQVDKNSTYRRFKVDPDFTSLAAAALALEEKLSHIVRIASEFRPPSEPLTLGQKKAWEKMKKEFDGLATLQGPSCNDVAHKILDTIVIKAKQINQHESAKQALENYLMVATLCQS